MLPSSGQFKDIECPFQEAGCGRPYCHFRHRRKSGTNSSATTASDSETSCDTLAASASHAGPSTEHGDSSDAVPTYNPTPISQLAASGRGHLPISYVPDVVVRVATERPMFRPLVLDKLPTYQPTPKSILQSNAQQAEGESGGAGKAGDSEEYTPSAPTVVMGMGTVGAPVASQKPVEEKLTDKILEGLSNKRLDDVAVENSTAQSESRSRSHKKSSSSSDPKKQSSNTNSSSSKSKTSKHNKDRHKDRDKERDKDRDKDKERDKKDKASRSSSSKSKDRESSVSAKDKDKPKTDKDKSKSATEKSRDKDKSKEKIKTSSSSNKISGSKKEKDDKGSRSESKESGNRTSTQSAKHKKNSSSSKSTSSKSKHKSSSSSSEKSRKKDNNDVRESRAPKKDTVNGHDDQDSSDVDTFAAAVPSDSDSSAGHHYEDDDDMTIEQECFKIYSEYQPTPIADLEESARKQPTVCKPASPSIDEQLIAETQRRRVAYDNAVDVHRPYVPPRPKEQMSPAMVMVNRMKEARKLLDQQSHPSAAGADQPPEKRSKISSGSMSAQTRIAPTSSSSSVVNSTGISAHALSKIKSRIAHNPDATSAASAPSSRCLVDDILNGTSNSAQSQSGAGAPRRIAPVSNVAGLARAKAQLASRAKLGSTLAQSHAKGASRTAHVPSTSAAAASSENALANLPDVLHAERSRLPINVRTRYLTMLAEETVKLYADRDEAHRQALAEEERCYQRCTALATYRNSAMMAVHRLRKQLSERQAAGLEQLLSDDSAYSAQAMVAAVDPLRGTGLYESVQRYLLGDEELELHGYPRRGLVAGTCRFVGATGKRTALLEGLGESERVCTRCLKVYLVKEDGTSLYDEECVYHPLRKRTFRGNSSYLCCQATGEDSGCATAACHVPEALAPTTGYQITMPPTSETDPRSKRVYALDCEMCYTTGGLELTRVTIIDDQCKTVYETLVRPLHPILDYNTQFSGITREQMDRTSTSILQVQANILHLCNANTVLIGHSLESDLKALRIVHDTVLDTAIMFPHRLGLPHKRALRALASEHLQKLIQNSVGGHDSAEDAIACMELVLWKVREDLKVRGLRK